MLTPRDDRRAAAAKRQAQEARVERLKAIAKPMIEELTRDAANRAAHPAFYRQPKEKR